MPPKRTGPDQVADFFANLDHPLKTAMERAREIIFGADKTLTEQIKWKAPSFCHNGDDRITFNVRPDGSIMLIFHRGAKMKDNCRGRLIHDPTGLLEWITDDRATIKFTSQSNVDERAADLKKVVKLWITAAAE